MTEDLEGLYAVALAFVRTYDEAAERKRRASVSRRAAKWGSVCQRSFAPRSAMIARTVICVV